MATGNMAEKSLEKRKDLFIVFMSLEEVYDRMDQRSYRISKTVTGTS